MGVVGLRGTGGRVLLERPRQLTAAERAGDRLVGNHHQCGDGSVGVVAGPASDRPHAVTDRSAQFTGSLPAEYDRYLGPMLFEPDAEDLAARLAVPPPAAVRGLA